MIASKAKQVKGNTTGGKDSLVKVGPRIFIAGRYWEIIMRDLIADTCLDLRFSRWPKKKNQEYRICKGTM